MGFAELAESLLLALRLVERTMEPVSILNFAPPMTPGAGPIASAPFGSTDGAAGQDGDASAGIPAFAQFVQEVLEQITSTDTTQSVSSSPASTCLGSISQEITSARATASASLPAPGQDLAKLFGDAYGAVPAATSAAATPAKTVALPEPKLQNPTASEDSSESKSSRPAGNPTPASLGGGLSYLISAAYAAVQPAAAPVNAPSASDSQPEAHTEADGVDGVAPLVGSVGRDSTAMSATSADAPEEPLPATPEIVPSTIVPSSNAMPAPSAPSAGTFLQDASAATQVQDASTGTPTQKFTPVQNASGEMPAQDVAPALPIENSTTTGKSSVAVNRTQEQVADGLKAATDTKPSKVPVVVPVEGEVAPKLSSVPISKILQQISELQPNARPAVSLPVAHGPSATQTALTEPAAKAAIAAVPFFAPHSAQFASLVSNAQHEPTAHAEVSQNAEIPSAPTAIHANPQDKSSNHGGQSQGSPTGSQDGAPDSNNATAKPEIPSFASAQAAANAVKADAPSSTVAQAPAIPVTSAPIDHSHESARPSAEAAPGNSPASLPQTSEPAANRFVSDAQILQASGHSEMRVAVQTDKLGAVELHARVAGDELGAAITVEKRDAHAALAVELPALQQALSEKQLRVEQLLLLQGAPHSTAGDAGAQSQTPQGDRGTQRQQTSAPLLQGESSAFPFPGGIFETHGIFDSQGRLSVRA